MISKIKNTIPQIKPILARRNICQAISNSSISKISSFLHRNPGKICTSKSESRFISSTNSVNVESYSFPNEKLSGSSLNTNNSNINNTLPSSLSQPPVRLSILPSGLRVASQDVSQSVTDTTATVGVWIDAGSRYETKKTNGVAHYCEHLAFKGTQKRTRLQLESEIEDLGAHLNAYTSREQTVYYSKCFKEDLGQGLDILADILGKSQMNATNVDQERGVILREMEEVEKSVEEVIFDRLHLTAFRDGQPLGFTILGPVENIQNIQQSHLQDYIRRNYTTDRMVIVAVGAVDHEELVKLAEKKFENFRRPDWNKRNIFTSPYIPNNFALQQQLEALNVENENMESKLKELIPPKPKFCSGELLYKTLDINAEDSTASGSSLNGGGMGLAATPSLPGQNVNTNNDLAHFAIAWEGVSWSDPDVITFMLMQSIVGTFRREESQKLLPGSLSNNMAIRNINNRVEQILLQRLISEGEKKPFDEDNFESTVFMDAMSDDELIEWQKSVLETATNFTPGGCDQFSGFNTCYKNTGLFGIYGATSSDCLRSTVEELIFAINRLSFTITQEEINRAKRELLSMLFASLDNTTSIAEDIGRQMLVYGRRISYVEMKERLDKIDVDEVKRVAKLKLWNQPVAVTALGKIDNMPSIEEIQEMNRMEARG